jgi:tetratricopeptide (TPR) repeat protein
MSLLIKALNKAEEAQAQNVKTEKGKANAETKSDKADSDLELSLSPADATPTEASPAPQAKPAAVQNKIQVSSQAPIQTATQSASQASKSIATPLAGATSTNSPKSAANVFSAKSVEASNQNTRLALIAGAGLLVLLAMGLYFYQFVDNTPDVVIPPRPLEPLAAIQQPEVIAVLPEPTPAPVAEAAASQVFEPEEPMRAPEPEQQEAPVKKMAKQAAMNVDEEFAVSENEAVVDETLVVANTNKKARKSKSLQFGESIASPSASINVSKTKSEAAGVNPVLISAYEAYNAGDDANAQKLYKQVLQRDVRNVDALLGLGAIASRQGRDADANGWFGKVLEVDPRNSLAQAALLDNQPQGNEANSESRIKNMLAKNPNDANLHVALGNLYAEQNQWPAAQQAYFDAYSLNTSADNAFNLAVSLDQMGKPKLALPYYQRALEQAPASSSIDKAALEARIAAIQ